jgi:hypothetical protein
VLARVLAQVQAQELELAQALALEPVQVAEA